MKWSVNPLQIVCLLHARYAIILDKTVEKIVYLESIFLNIVALPVLPSPPSPSPESIFKRKPDPWTFVESNIELGEGVSFSKYFCCLGKWT